MIIPCDTHGYSQGIQVSPDLADLMGPGVEWPRFFEINYMYLGESIILMLISAEFAAANGIPHTSEIDLPELYPEWHKEMVVVCERCALSHASQVQE